MSTAAGKTSLPSAAEQFKMIMEMRAQLEVMAETLNQRDQELAAIKSGEKLKIPEPPKFDGDRSELQTHLTKMEIYMSRKAALFPFEHDKVLFAAGYLTGKPFRWFEPKLRDFLDNQTDPTQMKKETKAIFNSYETYEESLKELFGQIDEEKEAESKL